MGLGGHLGVVWKVCVVQHKVGLTETFMDFEMPDGLTDGGFRL